MCSSTQEGDVTLLSESKQKIDTPGVDDFLVDLEKAGPLKSQLRQSVERFAGETLADNCLEKNTRVSNINLEARTSPTVALTNEQKYPVLVDGRHANLVVEGGSSVVLKRRDILQIVRNFMSRIESLSILGCGLGRRVRENSQLSGSLVGNQVMSGAYGEDAALWLLSHILYGDVKVSLNSENVLFKSLARDDDGMKIDVVMDAEIVASIHAATDGEDVYLCLSRRYIFKVKRESNVLTASFCPDIDVKNMQGCSLAPLFGLS